MSKSITIKDIEVKIRTSKDNNDYICLTDMARFQNPKEPKDVVKNWMRTIFTMDFLEIWEKMNNPEFKGVEFDSFRKDAGKNSFTMSPEKWTNIVGGIGIRVSRGNSGGTFAHKDIAFEFATWLSPEFKLYLIKEFQRLKEVENKKLSIGWDINRTLSKLNYRIHTDAIKDHLIPQDITIDQVNYIYADEADILNVALFGMTAKEWRNSNIGKKGNIRDYATIEQLLVLANMESINAELIRMNMIQGDRLKKLNQTAIVQMKSLIGNINIGKLGKNVELLNN
jgi:hypothetical protein